MRILSAFLLTFFVNALLSAQTVPHRDMHEITLTTSAKIENPYFDVQFQIQFERPGHSLAIVDGFYDGAGQFKARAYCDAVGEWKWRSISNLDALNNQSGAFAVAPSNAKGKLRKHPDDPHQLAYDNGEWFLHIGDTGYRYVTATEPQWKPYIDQAAEMGFTKIRAWFCQARSDVQILFNQNRDGLNLPYWQEIDKRIAYAHQRHPYVNFQLIPFGEDTDEIRRYGDGDRLSIFMLRYAQARFSAYPNIHWCLSNDRDIAFDNSDGKRTVSAHTINRMAQDIKNREAWGTLLTNHQRRFQGYSFVDADWSDIITLEDLDQIDGRIALQYRAISNDPVVMDEDRYELYREPLHPRYFFRRLMWAHLLSGGMATYGGMKTYEAYDGELSGIYGYLDSVNAGKLAGGAHDFPFIRQFFKDAGLTMVGMRPNDAMVGYDPPRFKCAENDAAIMVYLQNPDSRNHAAAAPAPANETVAIHLPRGTFSIQWFDPKTGKWAEDETLQHISGGQERKLKSPISGDAILLLQKVGP